MLKLSESLLLALPVSAGAAQGLPLDLIELPDGFRIEIYAEVPNARSLTLSDQGIVYVGSRSGDKVHAVIDEDSDGKADRVVVVADELDTPNGVAWYDGDLYVAEIERILKYPDIDARLDNPPEASVVYDKLPDETHHGWRYIGFGPEGKLYVPVGVPCNICKEEGFGIFLRMNADGSAVETYAQGIRNSVGFDFDPATGDLWFTDNGRDWLGDDRPPDELNHAPRKGMHFGFPYCHGVDIRDPQYGQGEDCAKYTPPAAELGPHVAALGMRFYTGEQFPEKYRGGMFIAEHGSWNRSDKIGYRLVFASKTESGANTEIFASGWLQGENAWGRPVDVLVMPDGALLVSDDRAGVIYRISYKTE